MSILNKYDTNTQTWAKIKHHLTDELARLREKNDDEELSDIDTAVLRGHIKRIKFTIALGASENLAATRDEVGAIIPDDNPHY